MKTYQTRYRPELGYGSAYDGPSVRLSDEDTRNAKTLASALREQGVLPKGASLRSFSPEPGGLVVFPSAGKLLSITLHTPAHKAYQKLARARRHSTARMIAVVERAGYGDAHDLSPTELRARALKITRARRSR